MHIVIPMTQYNYRIIAPMHIVIPTAQYNYRTIAPMHIVIHMGGQAS